MQQNDSLKNIFAMPILLVDDDQQALKLLSLSLKIAGFNNIHLSDSGEKALQFIKNQDCELAVIDIIMPGMQGNDLLNLIKENDAELPVIMATGVNEVDMATQCIRNGAFDYIVKPIDPDRIIHSIQNALSVRALKWENAKLTEHMLTAQLKQPDVFSSIITRDLNLINIFKYIEAIAPSFHPILITGETGTGKELIAKAVHEASKVQGKFLAINVAGLDDTLLSDTLFGHVKGAYTGADASRPGMVESASKGTLFLDEIGDLSVQSQVKLLRLLQEREYFPLGSDLPRKSSARIITATHKGIDILGQPGGFRKDLFYRLRSHHIHLPPLRERKEDLEWLVHTFIEAAAREQGKTKPAIPSELFTLLKTYHFPGNIRELQGLIQEAMSIHEKHILSLQTFRKRIGTHAPKEGNQQDAAVPIEGKVIFPPILPTLNEIQDLLIQEALRRADGNQTVSAGLLGITRQTLSYHLNKSRTRPA